MTRLHLRSTVLSTLLLGLSAAGAIAASPAAAAPCPGADACPYTAVGQVGSRGEGVLRFPQTVAVGPDGAIYVGDQYSHVVQIFDSLGVYRREVGQSGTGPGKLTAVGGVAVGPDNSIYVADGAERIHRFAQDGTVLDSWGSRGDAPGEFKLGAGGGNDSGAGGGLAVGPDGSVYVADTRNDRIQKFDADGSRPRVIVAPGRVKRPQGLAVRGGRLVVADDLGHRLVVFDTGGRFITTVGKGLGIGPGQLQNPYDVAFDGRGRLFVADDLNHRVVYFGPKPNYRYRGRWGSFGTGPGNLAYPRGLGADAAGRTYVADPGNNRVNVFSPSGRALRSIGRSSRVAGEFIDPRGTAVDASGVRAVADTVGGRIQLIGPDGVALASFGAPNPGPTILSQPTAVTFDAGGGVYALDQRRGRITVFDRSGNVVRTIGSRGTGDGKLSNPVALAVDDAGVVSVADEGNRRIARFNPDGSWRGAIGSFSSIRGIATTPAGDRLYASDGRLDRITVWSTGDGEQIDRFGRRGTGPGRINGPSQIALDGAGRLWVADRLNDRIQAFDADGNSVASFGGRGIDPGQFIRPTGVSVGCDGSVVVGDSDNNRVQTFALAAPAPVGCRALPAIVAPPQPNAPALPPDSPVQLTATPIKGALLGRRRLGLRARCDRPCSLKITGTVQPTAKPAKGRRVVKVAFAERSAKLPAGRLRKVYARLPAANARKLRTALRGRRGVTVTLTLTATAEGSPSTTLTRTFPARR